MNEQSISIDGRGVLTAVNARGQRLVMAPTTYKLRVDYDPRGMLRVEVNGYHEELGHFRLEVRQGEDLVLSQ